MKKSLLVSVTCLAMLLISSTSAFAQNAVSEMATGKGGQHIAECAKKMDKGISECAKLDECSLHAMAE